MKLLVMSDNHGNWPFVNDLIQKYRQEVDLILHCGDSEFPADDPIWDNVDYVVRGNMDFDPQFRLEQVIETPEGKIYMTHGHLSGVNTSNVRLIEQAQQDACQFVFHGHTHALYAQEHQGIFIANPGSISKSRGPYPHSTYMIVTVEDEGIQCEYFDLNFQAISELGQYFNR